MANPPLPPVRLPRAPGSSKDHSRPRPSESTSDQPAGVVGLSNVSVLTGVVVYAYPAASHEAKATGSATSATTGVRPSVTLVVACS